MHWDRTKIFPRVTLLPRTRNSYNYVFLCQRSPSKLEEIAVPSISTVYVIRIIEYCDLLEARSFLLFKGDQDFIVPINNGNNIFLIIGHSLRPPSLRVAFRTANSQVSRCRIKLIVVVTTRNASARQSGFSFDFPSRYWKCKRFLTQQC